MFNKKLIIPLLILFIDVISFSFILPAISFIVKSFGYGAKYVGISISLTALGVMIGGVFFGKLSDKIGRKNSLIISLLLNLFGYITFFFSNSLSIFIFARILNGLGGGGMSVIQAYISDISKGKEKIINMGYMGAIFGSGFILGPTLGYFISGKNLHEIGLYCSLFFIISISICIKFFNPLDIKTSKNNKTLFILKEKLPYLIMSFTIMATLLGVQTIFPLYLSDYYDFKINDVYFVFAIMGISGAIYQIGFFKHVKNYFSEKIMMISGILIFILGLFIAIYNTNQVVLYIILILFVIGISNVNNIIFSLISENNKQNEFGTIYGLNTFFSSLGELFGSLVAGFLYHINHSVTFIFFIIFLFVLFLYFYYKVFLKK